MTKSRPDPEVVKWNKKLKRVAVRTLKTYIPQHYAPGDTIDYSDLIDAVGFDVYDPRRARGRVQAVMREVMIELIRDQQVHLTLAHGIGYEWLFPGDEATCYRTKLGKLDAKIEDIDERVAHIDVTKITSTFKKEATIEFQKWRRTLQSIENSKIRAGLHRLALPSETVKADDDS